jgi:hypothetical protein
MVTVVPFLMQARGSSSLQGNYSGAEQVTEPGPSS